MLDWKGRKPNLFDRYYIFNVDNNEICVMIEEVNQYLDDTEVQVDDLSLVEKYLYENYGLDPIKGEELK